MSLLAPIAVWTMKGGVVTAFTVPAVAFYGIPAAALVGTALALNKVEDVIENRRKPAKRAKIDAEYDRTVAQYNARKGR